MVIYGRRRCGKSRLINQLGAHTIIYHLADQSEPSIQRSNAAQDISREFSDFSGAVYPTWESLLRAYFAHNKANNANKALVIDEFPYLVQLDSALPSIIQKLYDTGAFSGHLILCGSSQRMMHGLVLDDSAPLYGRAAEIIKVYPLAPGWVRPALQVESADAVKAYSIWGGVPRYWEAALPFDSLESAVAELVFNRNGLFHHEPHRLLKDDMRSDVQPHSLLSVIAAGAHRLSEIAGRIGKQASSLSNPLNLLIDLGYIKREIPFGESTKSTKRSLYRLCDPFLLFWYRFVYPSLSLLEQDVVGPVMQDWRTGFGHHLGRIWEELARLTVPRIAIGGVQWKEAHRWWGRDLQGRMREIDVVAESMDGSRILIGEAKWRSHDEVRRIVHRLQHVSESAPFAAGKKTVHAIWLPDATATECEGCAIIDAHQALETLRY